MATSILVAKIGFWACATLILYTYLFYPVLLLFAYSVVQLKRDLVYVAARQERRVSGIPRSEPPSVSILIPAFNEEAHLRDKLDNLADLDYPEDKLETIIVSDGSSDRTNEILQNIRTAHTHVLLLPERRGKANALNLAAAEASGSILLFSDAATLLPRDGVHKLARHFRDPSVGAVCGSLEFAGSNESKRTEGVYWKYESALRIMEARLGATLTASGAYYAIRRSCYQPLKSTAILDDFLIPMNVRKQGYRVVYDPEAVAQEFSEASVSGEFRRRVRLAAGSFRALPELARTPMRGFTGVAFLSHKVLRWIMPFLFLGMLGSNIPLIDAGLYGWAFAFQCMFYLLAVMGMLSARHHLRLPGLVCYFLCAMNLAFLIGSFRALKRNSTGLWERADT